ncbi:MAG TPA: TIGR04255 family protein [Solirubrobacteraceae bacterium]|jgi:uncharacterized protein (TIGR04255 family)|nr:TIGR04255 family protein [Solirubrobacteraceae bacterium]
MLNLPEPDRDQLPRSPLELVVCQVRFESIVGISETARGLAFYEALGGRDGQYRNLIQAQSQALNVTFAPGASPTFAQPQSLSGWQLKSADENWEVELMPDHLGLETKAYSTWQDFRDRFSAALDALSEIVGPTLEHRIGLRYIDRIADLEIASPAGWTPYIAPELLGSVAHPTLGGAILTQQQQVLIDLGDDARCRFAHGLLKADNGQLHYFLDYDMHREGGRAFDRQAIMSKLDEFNTDALKLFQASATDALLATFTHTWKSLLRSQVQAMGPLLIGPIREHSTSEQMDPAQPVGGSLREHSTLLEVGQAARRERTFRSRAYGQFIELAQWLERSRAETADLLEIGRTTPSAWEREGREPQPRHARRLYQTHALLDSLISRQGSAETHRWLHAGSPSPLELIAGGRLDLAEDRAHSLIYGHPAGATGAIDALRAADPAEVPLASTGRPVRRRKVTARTSRRTST